MRGEEVSREIPFIFSRAFSRHAAGERVGRAGEGFVCGWKRGGSREAPGRPDTVSKLEEAELPRGADGAGDGMDGSQR